MTPANAKSATILGSNGCKNERDLSMTNQNKPSYI
jgi:hypothetical protein